MKKLLLTVVIVVGLVGVERVEAQSTCFLPSACGTTTFTGGTLTGPLLLPDGSAAAPALAQASNSDNGIYFATNAIQFSSNGTQKFLVTPTDVGVVGAALSVYSDALGLRLGSNSDTLLYRDAANTLALRNGTNAQTFNVYNTYTGGSNYERGGVKWNGNQLEIFSENAGTGSARAIYLNPPAGQPIYTELLSPPVNDTWDTGIAAANYRTAYLSRSIQGSKSKALTESAATAVTQIAVPQTAGANYADATIEWVVYAADATDSQTRKGSTYLTAVNKAGTETCTVGDVGTTVAAVSAGTLTCTTSCITGLTDVVQFALNCVSSLTQTTLTAQVRLDMMQPNTVTPQ